MNIITFLFYAALACLYLGIGLPYLELVAGVCALVLAVKSI
jgi:hypothetical protein